MKPSAYTKEIYAWKADGSGVVKVLIDYYTVADAFSMPSAIEHAVKKQLMINSGRGHKDAITDAKEAIGSIERWIEDEEAKNAMEVAELRDAVCRG